jgi:hypothetical protein
MSNLSSESYCFSHLIFLDFIATILFGEMQEFWSFWYSKINQFSIATSSSQYLFIL